MSNQIFSISEAAKYLGVFSLTLRNWEKKGFIKSFRTPGGHRRFSRQELERVFGIGVERDKLKESIQELEKIKLRGRDQQAVKTIINHLRNVSENI